MKTSLSLVAFVLALAGCSNPKSQTTAAMQDGGNPTHRDGGDRQGDAGGSTRGDAARVATADASSGAADASSGVADAHVPPVSSSHRVIYWGNLGSAGTPTAVVLEVPSGKKTMLDLSAVNHISPQDGKLTRDGSRLVLAQDATSTLSTKLWSFDTKSGNATELLQNSRYIYNVRLSQDGKYVAYLLADNTSGMSYVADITGKTAPAELADGHPQAFSPGGKLAVSVSVTGTNTDDVLIFTGTGTSWSSTPGPKALDDGSDLVWDANDKLYYLRTAASGDYLLYGFDVASGKESEITAATSMLAGAHKPHDLKMSPDGKFLALRAGVGGSAADDVFVYDIHGDGFMRATDTGTRTPAGDVSDLQWSPTSNTLLMFVEWTSVSGSTYVVGDQSGNTVSFQAMGNGYALSNDAESLSPDGATLYTIVDGRTQGVHELFSVDLKNIPADPLKTPVQAASGDNDVLGVVALP
jgi:dipeptidyl aminopeptidase/acylaminoacyl peptidase